jgi:hypothetical protein
MGHETGGEPTVTGRQAVTASGVVLIMLGLGGLLWNAADTHPTGWLVWFVAAALAHDLLVAPLVLGTAVLVKRLPPPYRGPARTGLVLAASVVLLALPFVLGFGRRPDNPSVLPQAYGRHLATIMILIGLISAAIAVLNAYARPMGRTILTVLGVLLAIWLLFTVIGMVIATLKFFLWIGLLAVLGAVIVMVVSRMSK